MLPSRWRVFQQDNAKPHAAITTAWLRSRRVRVLNWPACSPDLSPIENIWCLIKWKIGQSRPRTLQQQETYIRQEWKWKWSDATFGQVWWPILGICALHLTHPTCTHTAVNTPTHHEHTHGAVGSHLCCGARGAVWGSVPCSRAPQSWYWGWRERCTFTPPTYNSCRPETRTRNLSDYESNSLTIRPREWDQIPTSKLQKLITSMPRHLQTVLKRRGDATPW